MAVAVDSSVLLDLLVPGASDQAKSVRALERALPNGLVICEIVIAEIAPVLGEGAVEEFLPDWELQFVPCSLASAKLAGEMFHAFLLRGGKRGRVVPDFLIAAHAQLHAHALLTRDLGYARDYFDHLKVIGP